MFKRFSKFLPILIFFSTLFCAKVVESETNTPYSLKSTPIPSSYLNSKKELEDYIIGIGDGLFIEFYPAIELSGFFQVNEEGELYLPRLNEVNVNGLTSSELEKLLEENYSEFLIAPEIKVKIAIFKEITVNVKGEVRYPGSYNFPSYKSASASNFFENNNTLSDQFSYEKASPNSTKISDIIRKAGGLTSLSDMTSIKIVRNIPLGKGGGKKVALVNLNELLNGFDTVNDLRLFDGDQIFIPALENKNNEQIAKSVLSGLSPRFVEVNVFGRVNNPGTFKIPLEGTLSDAIDITGPIKPLSGNVILIRYNSDGTVSRKKISYSAEARRGSKRNPYIKEGDLINVTSSVLAKTTGLIQEITAPLQGIYFTKELIESF